jgi:hypothetical protein
MCVCDAIAEVSPIFKQKEQPARVVKPGVAQKLHH